MLHETIKNTAIRMQSTDNILFGENKKAHPLGIGGMSIDMAYDSALIQLNAEAYDSATEFQLYTESVLRSLTKFTDTCRGASCISMYKESKAKALLEKIKAWFKKAWAYLKKKATQIKDWVKKLFTRKGKKAKTTPPSETKSAGAEEVLKEFDNLNPSDRLIGQIIDECMAEGIAHIFNKDSIKYRNSDIEALALATVESAYRHGDVAMPSRAREFWDACKGTEYEKSAVAAISVMYICSTGVYPYMPSGAVAYIASKHVDKSKRKITNIFRGAGWMDNGAASNIAELYADVLGHVKDMFDVISGWGDDIKNTKVLALYKVDSMITAISDIEKAISVLGVHSDAVDVGTINSVTDKVMASIGEFDGVVANPKSIVTETRLHALMRNYDEYKGKLDVFKLIDLYNNIDELDSLMDGFSQKATKASDDVLLTDDETTYIYKSMIGCINPLMKAANSLGMTATSLFKSLSDAEEDMVGFCGVAASDSTPITAIGKAIAEDAEMSSRMMKRLGFIK